MVRDKFSHFTDKLGLSFFSSNGIYLHCSLCADDVAFDQDARYVADSSKNTYRTNHFTEHLESKCHGLAWDS